MYFKELIAMLEPLQVSRYSLIYQFRENSRESSVAS